MKLNLNLSRGDNSESMKVRLSFLQATLHQDLLVVTVKYYDNIPKAFQVMARTRNCI